MTYTYYLFNERKKIGYTFFNILLFVEAVYGCANATLNTLLQNNNIPNASYFALTYLLTLIIWGAIWVFPNYIYFKKRKNLFCK